MGLTINYQIGDHPLQQVDDEQALPAEADFIWYDYENPTSLENHQLQNDFNFNKLEIDDTVNGTPRAKYKTYASYQYIVVHGIRDEDYRPTAINFFIKDNVLITYHHTHEQAITDINNTLCEHTIDRLTASSVMLYIIDQLVDYYFDYIYDIEEKVYDFEDKHVNDTTSKFIMDYVFKLRSDIIKLKRIVFPMHELIVTLKDSKTLFNSHKDYLYIQHIEDHMIKQENSIKTSDEMTNEIRENYESYSSYKMNNIMQILTLVSVIFSPLALITGIYGMNFKYMPELNWHYSYFAVLVIMLIIASICIWYFKKKKWF